MHHDPLEIPGSTSSAQDSTLVSVPLDLRHHPKHQPLGFSNTPELPESINVITLGDLHANVKKFIAFLLASGLVTISKDDYISITKIEALFAHTHRKQADIQASITEFKELLSKLTIIHSHRTVRLIGDELADRGYNDLLILLVYEWLAKHNIHTETLLSNHGIEFNGAYERLMEEIRAAHYGTLDFATFTQRVANGELTIEEHLDHFVNLYFYAHPDIDLQGQVNSLNELRRLVIKKTVSLQRLAQLTREYQASLKLIAYTLHDDGITLATHAPCDIDVVARTAEQLGIVVPQDWNQTKENLAQLIDAINTRFQQKYVASGKIYATGNVDKLDPNCSSQYPNKDHAIFDLVWHRASKDWQFKFTRECGDPTFTVNYDYGHDRYFDDQPGINCVDSSIGKGIFRGFSGTRAEDIELFATREQRQEESFRITHSTGHSRLVLSSHPAPAQTSIDYKLLYQELKVDFDRVTIERQVLEKQLQVIVTQRDTAKRELKQKQQELQALRQQLDQANNAVQMQTATCASLRAQLASVQQQSAAKDQLIAALQAPELLVVEAAGADYPALAQLRELIHVFQNHLGSQPQADDATLKAQKHRLLHQQCTRMLARLDDGTYRNHPEHLGNDVRKLMMVSLHRRWIGVRNTTSSGMLLRNLLSQTANDDVALKFQNVINLAFGDNWQFKENGRVSYTDMRLLISGQGDHGNDKMAQRLFGGRRCRAAMNVFANRLHNNDLTTESLEEQVSCFPVALSSKQLS